MLKWFTKKIYSKKAAPQVAKKVDIPDKKAGGFDVVRKWKSEAKDLPEKENHYTNWDKKVGHSGDEKAVGKSSELRVGEIFDGLKNVKTSVVKQVVPSKIKVQKPVKTVIKVDKIDKKVTREEKKLQKV